MSFYFLEMLYEGLSIFRVWSFHPSIDEDLLACIITEQMYNSQLLLHFALYTIRILFTFSNAKI